MWWNHISNLFKYFNKNNFNKIFKNNLLLVLFFHNKYIIINIYIYIYIKIQIKNYNGIKKILKLNSKWIQKNLLEC